MLNHLKKIGILSLLLIFMFSLIMINTPTTTAGPLMNAYTCQSKVVISWDENIAKDPLLPYDMVKEIPLDINFQVTGIYAQDISKIIEESGYDMFIYLSIIDTPDWCSATIVPPLIFAKPTSDFGNYKATLSILINENAPAIIEGKIGVLAEVKSFSSINGSMNYQDVTFIPGYLPILNLKTPKNNAKFINPNEAADFNIEIENTGNADTIVKYSLIDPPKGWTITLPETVIEAKSTKKINLIIKPPDGFGYHNDRKVIQVALIPKYVNNESLAGKEYILSFAVQSRGFSSGLGAPGFDSILVLLSFINLAFILKIYKRKNVKTYQSSRGKDNL